MAHTVTCQYCKTSFDRDKIAYVEVSSRRYGHASCYLREKEKNPQILELEIIDPTNFITCCYCKKQIDKRINAYKQITNSRYAHLGCAQLEDAREKTDEEKLDIYICKLFNSDFVYPRIKKQIKQFIGEYNYSYTGILKALKYFYEIQHHDIAKANGTISIVPYIYNDAYNYYYSLWLAEQKNTAKDIKDYIPKEVVISIACPQRRPLKKSYFNFLDKDEIIDGEQ